MAGPTSTRGNPWARGPELAPCPASAQTPADRTDLIVVLRHCRMSGPEIAQTLGMPVSTVGAVLKRAGLGQVRNLTPRQPVVRYERARPGDLVHMDAEKLGRIKRIGHRITGDRRDTTRGAGWEFVHVCIDDASRLAYAEVLEDEKAISVIAFFRRARAFYRRHGVRVRSVMTDNGSAYVSSAFARECQKGRLRHLRTRPYRPCTNGKAERFIRTMLTEWAYAVPYPHSRQRTAVLALWLEYYNWFRPHGSLGRLPPSSRLGPAVNNLSGSYT